MKKLFPILALLLCTAASAQYTGPRIASGNTFQVSNVQPEGVFCEVNPGTSTARQITGEVVNLTNQVLTALPLKVVTRVRCKADTLKHGDTVVMVTTRTDRPEVGRSAPHIYTLGPIYGCNPYQSQLICRIVPKVLTIDAVAVPLPVTPPVTPPPVVVVPPSTGTWTRVAAENQPFTATGTVRFGYGTRWVQKVVAGAGECSNDFFGSDPAVGDGKYCELLQ